jgi:LysR family transcriptional regulator, transcriptional activator of the cysJI operon
VKLNGIDLNKLNVFCSVIKNGGYRGASEELNLTRSAISQAISSFEGTLGHKLFHRSGTRLLPTERCMRFYNEVITYQNGLQSSVDTLLGRSRKVEGLLRIGAYLEFTKSKLMPVVEEFLIRHPHVQIKFTFDSPSRIEKLLEDNRLDLSITVFPHRGIKSIKTQRVYQEELVLIAHKDLLPSRVKAETLKLAPVIDYYPNHIIFKRWWKTHFHQLPLAKVTPRVFAATADMVIELAKHKLGVGVVPKYLIEGQMSELRIIQPSESRLLDYIWLNEPRTLQQTPQSLAFKASITEAFQLA